MGALGAPQFWVPNQAALPGQEQTDTDLHGREVTPPTSRRGEV